MATKDAAVAALTQAGLIAFVYWSVSATVPAGSVISQSPVGGSVVPVGTEVTITVCTGPGAGVGTVVVPNVVGMLPFDAGGALAVAGVSIDKYSWVVSSAPQSSVVAQSLAAGSAVEPGAICVLSLSAGPSRVPATVVVPVVV